MQKDNRVSLYHTSCKECTFAEYEGKTQTGCKAGRLEKFGEAVLEVQDQEKEFFVIDGRKCNLFRTDEVTLDKARRQIRVPVTVVVPVRATFTDSDIAAICLHVADVHKQYPLAQVLFVREFDPSVKAHPSELNLLIRHNIPDDSDMPWRIVHMLRVSEGIRDLVDEACHSIKDGYYCVLELGSELPAGYLEKFDSVINDELRKTLVVAPLSPNLATGLIVSVAYSKSPMTGGNKPGWFSNPYGGNVDEGTGIEPDEIFCPTIEKKIFVSDPEGEFWMTGAELASR